MSRFQMLTASRNRKGFTLIELLVVVLILAILMAVALPLYLSAVADSQKKTCRANMQTIANAVQAARIKANLPDFSSFITTATITAGAMGNVPDLNAVPVCPTGGTYTIVAGTVGAAGSDFAISCTNHLTFEPGVSTN